MAEKAIVMLLLLGFHRFQVKQPSTRLPTVCPCPEINAKGKDPNLRNVNCSGQRKAEGTPTPLVL